MTMKIDTYLTAHLPESEDVFNDSIVIMIDVLRASSTICSALFHGAKEIISTEGLDKAVKVYNSLSREVRFLGGERAGIKPDGFDAGNSPSEYSDEKVHNRSVIITTTNGTRIFQRAKMAQFRLVGAFVNHSAIIDFIMKNIQKSDSSLSKICFVCAGNNGNFSFEDALCAGAMIDRLVNRLPIFELSDSSEAARNLFNVHKDNLMEFILTREHASQLAKLGFQADIEDCLTFDKYNVVPLVNGSSIVKI